MADIGSRRVMGGVFGLESDLGPEGHSVPRFITGPHYKLANARGGLRLLLKALKPQALWMPRFICDSMIEVVGGLETSLQLYSLDDQFNPAFAPDWLNQVRPGDLFLMVDFFGYVPSQSMADVARSTGAIVVEDAAHALLSATAGTLGDYVLWSPRKYAGLADGGVLQSTRLPLPVETLAAIDESWWRDAYEACERRATFDAGGPRDFLAVHQQAEAAHPLEPTRMSEHSASRLGRVDWQGIASRRLENHARLDERLQHLRALPDPADGCVPYGYTVRLANRDEVRAHLFRADIFPSVLWPADSPVRASDSQTKALGEELMTIPTDQRYTSADMDRVADLVLELAVGA